MRFAVKGDWGYGTSAQAAVTRRMCRENRRIPLAFVLTTGDNFYLPDGRATVANHHRPERCLIRAGVRWRAAWGNHDLAGADTGAVLGARRRYYTFRAGPARVIVLDGNAPVDTRQLRFLRRALALPRAGPVIVAHHQPTRTAGLHPPSVEQQRRWEPLLRRGGVALVLQGHNHAYERIVRGGVTYITTGGGGAPLYPCVRVPPGLRRCRPQHHFLLVNATAHRVAIRAVTARGGTIERVVLSVTPRR